MSFKQVEANRRNGRLSAGPKTPNGKSVSRMNALKHGLRSAEVVVRGRCIKESRREFLDLQKRLWEDLQPVGILEEIQAEIIITTYWRLRRVHKAESGEIALSVDGGQWNRDRIEPFGIGFWICCATYGGAEDKLKNSSFGNSYLESLLENLRASVMKEGEISESALKALAAGLAGKPSGLTREVERFRSKLKQNSEGLETSALKEQTLAFIDGQMESVSLRKSKCEEREQMEEEAHQAADVLPSADTLDKLLRYETALQKEMFRAMNRLERLQRRRHGENVPAPVAMEISTGS